MTDALARIAPAVKRPPKERRWAARYFARRSHLDGPDDDGDRGSRFRICPVCGLLYAPDLPDDRRTHRSMHARIVATWDPKPRPGLALEHAQHGLAVPVTDHGPRWRLLWKCLYECARAFNYETRWGVLWSVAPHYTENGKGYLLTDPQGRAVGGAVVRWREYTNHAPEWVLAWVWIAPGHRRQGLLRQLWARLAPLYPGIFPESPYSDAMAAFVLQQPGMPEHAREAALNTLSEHIP